MGRVAEGGRRNYETLRLGIQNFFRRLSITIGPAPYRQFLPVRLKIHMPFKKVHMPFKRITARPGYLAHSMNDTPKTRQEIARPRSGAKSAMSKPRTSRPAAHPPAGPAPRQPAYSQHARSYEQRTGAFQRHRDTLVEALPVSRGQVVLDVGCGTGLCYGLLQEKVGPQGRVVGIEESPEMAAIARERIAAEGWPNVTVVQSPAEDAKIPVTADAALFCAVHDILQSPGALLNIMSNLRPGAWVAAGGGKWAPWAMMALNLQVRTLHAPYVRSFTGFGRPWNHLEELIEDIHVREVALGSGYIVTGQAPRSRRRPSGKPGPSGLRDNGAVLAENPVLADSGTTVLTSSSTSALPDTARPAAPHRTGYPRKDRSGAPHPDSRPRSPQSPAPHTPRMPRQHRAQILMFPYSRW